MCEPTNVARRVAAYEASQLDSSGNIQGRESSVLLFGVTHAFSCQLRL